MPELDLDVMFPGSFPAPRGWRGDTARSHRALASRAMPTSPTASRFGQRVLRRLAAALDTLPGRIVGAVATRRGRGQGCASTPGPEPVPGPRTGGSLPSRPVPPVRHGPAWPPRRKTLPRQRINGKAGAHRRKAKVRIDPSRRLRAQVRPQVGAQATAKPASGELNLLRGAAAVLGRRRASRSVSTVGQANRLAPIPQQPLRRRWRSRFTARPAPAPRARSWLAAHWLARLRVSVEPPDPRFTSARHKEAADMVGPRKAEAEGMDGAAHQIRQRQARAARPALMTSTVAVGGQRGHGPPPASAGDREAWPQGVCGTPKALITAGDHVSSYRTARSAILAVRSTSDSTAPKQRQYRLKCREVAGVADGSAGSRPSAGGNAGPATRQRCGAGVPRGYRERPQVRPATAFRQRRCASWPLERCSPG